MSWGLCVGVLGKLGWTNSTLLPRKVKAIPVEVLGFQEVEAPRFLDNRHMKMVRLSALRIGRLYPPRKYSWYSFLLEAESIPGP